MKGILIASHGDFAKGMAQSATLFFGTEIPQMDYACIQQGESTDEYRNLIQEKLKKLDTGDGVVVLTDLFGGTPAHEMTGFIKDGIDVIAGANFAVLMELLSERSNQQPINVEHLVESGRNGLKIWNPAKEEISNDLF